MVASDRYKPPALPPLPPPTASAHTRVVRELAHEPPIECRLFSARPLLLRPSDAMVTMEVHLKPHVGRRCFSARPLATFPPILRPYDACGRRRAPTPADRFSLNSHP